MKRITRDVDPTALRHLLEPPARAYLAFNDGSAVDAAPVVFEFRDDRYYVGLAPEIVARGVGAGATVTLLLDDGWYWYDLQSLRLRGVLRAAEAVGGGATAATTWFEVMPRVLIAWDYGTLREVGDDDAD